MIGVDARVLYALLYAVACSPAAAQKSGRPRWRKSSIRLAECCEAQPDWDTAVTLRCVCHRSSTEIHLYEEDIPSSVESIVISQTLSVAIHASAIYALPHLKSFIIDNSNTLEINTDGLVIKKNAELQSLRISAIHDVEIHGSAVSGYWESATKISIQNITNLSLNVDSFSHGTTTSGPTLEVVDVEQFVIGGGGAFSGPVSLISITRVNTPISSCSHKTFGKQIIHLKLNGLTINDVQTGCFQGSGALARLSIQSCDLKIVRSRAFSGKIEVVEIDNSRMGQVPMNGFDVQVNRLSMTDSLFVGLTQDSLSITAQESIILDHVWVDRLERNALVSLRTARDTSVHTAGLIIRALRVVTADEGSLAFDASVSICLSDLKIGINGPGKCPAETRWLVGSGEDRPLSANQLQVHRQLHRPGACPAGRREPPRDDETAPSCDLDPTTATGRVLTELHLAVAALALLSAALLIVLVWSMCTNRVPLPCCLPRAVARSRKPHLGLSAESSAGAGQSVRAAAAPPDRFSEEVGYSTVQDQTTAESQEAGAGRDNRLYQGAAAAAAASEGCPSDYTNLYDEVRESGLLPSPGKDDSAQWHSSPSALTVHDSNPPSLPPVTLERLQLVRDHQELDNQESVYEEMV